MTQRKAVRVWLIGLVLATVFLASGTINEPTFALSGVQSKNPNTSLIGDSGQTTSERETPETRADLYLYEGSPAGGSAYIMVDVALDDDYFNHADENLEFRVGRTFDAANTLLDEVGLNIKVASIQVWQSDDRSNHISARLTDAARQTEQSPGNLFLAISHQTTAIHDGLARDSGNMVIVASDEGDEQQAAALIVHEIAHLLGAQHHEVSEECQGYGCIMDASGFAASSTWCEHHIQQIKDSVAAKLAAQVKRG